MTARAGILSNEVVLDFADGFGWSSILYRVKVRRWPDGSIEFTVNDGQRTVHSEMIPPHVAQHLLRFD